MARVRPPLLAVLAASAIAGCAPRRPPPDLSLDPAALLAQVRAAAARVGSVGGDAQLRVDAPGARGAVPAYVAAARPDRLHVETFDFFGNPLAVLVTAEGRLSLYDAREKVFYRGEATPENLARLVPLPIGPGELVDVLCGSAPLLATTPVRADPAPGHVTLVLEGPGRTQTLRVGAGASVQRSEIRGPAGPAYDVAFGDFRDRGRGRFPHDVSLAAAAARVRIELEWTDVEPNAALDRAMFRLAPPRGARVVELGSGAPAALVPGTAP